MDLQRSPANIGGKKSAKKVKSPTHDIRNQLQDTSLNVVQGFSMGLQKCTTRKDKLRQ